MEPGGGNWVVVVNEPGPNVEDVEFVPEPGRAADTVYVASEYGPGVKMVYAAKGAHLVHDDGGPSSASFPSSSTAPPPDPDIERLLAMAKEVADEQAANADRLLAVANLALELANRPWPSDYYLEEIFQVGCAAPVLLVSRFNMIQEAELPVRYFSQQLIDRDWLLGGPNGVLTRATAQGILQTAGQLTAARSPRPAVKPKKKGLFRR
jgi:hypothetical protein